MIRSNAAKHASLVDALRAINGTSSARACFAEGRNVRGTYIPSVRADEITTSQSFTRPSRVLARFSVDGYPNGSETDNLDLRGFSFRLGDEDHRSDILTQSAPVHYARTLDQMLAFLEAHSLQVDGRRDPVKVRAFTATHPETRHQADYIAAHPLPPSFADTTYWAVHAFPATNAIGDTQFIKFKVAPVGSDAALPKGEVKTSSADALHRDLERHIADSDMRFSLMALLGRPDDPMLDVTVRWPDEDSREAIRLGTIVITGVEPDEACDAFFFDPANLAEGIGYPPDEIFAARRAVYAMLLAQRR
ncbi:catalase [Bradyrhizobium embrapense]|uniref:catalase n=1 Tax=Bradyrhizobium embrapense TaxID=630921 RepID=UPI000AB941D0|nr:catalase [Bradyrhizobium embrapense]